MIIRNNYIKGFSYAIDIQNNSSVTGIKFYVGAGNIKDISIKIYGIVDS